MKKLRLLLLWLTMVVTASAGTLHPFERAFSSAAAEIVQFDFDIRDSLLEQPHTQHWLFYRDTASVTWSTGDLSLLYESCDTMTMSTQIMFTPPSGVIEWCLRSEVDTVVASQSPKNVDNIFPPPAYLWADLGADPIDDTVSADGLWLDITHFYMTYSDERLYAQIDVREGGFPLNSGLFTYYVYGVGIIDPDKVEDSIAFALAYVSVPLLVSPGFYRFDLRDSSYTRVGDIDYLTDGNTLVMSCSLDDLVAQPEWTSWPPPAGLIGAQAATGTRTILSDKSNDISSVCAFDPHSNLLDFSGNTAPTLSSWQVQIVGSDSVSVDIMYQDSDNHLPVVRLFHLGGEQHALRACIKDYASGAWFSDRFAISGSGWNDYFFEFSDGDISVTTPLDSLYFGPGSYVPGDADGNTIVNISDAVYLIAYIFGGGAAPDPLAAGDADCNGIVNISDAVYLIAYIFGGGPAPCA